MRLEMEFVSKSVEISAFIAFFWFSIINTEIEDGSIKVLVRKVI